MSPTFPERNLSRLTVGCSTVTESARLCEESERKQLTERFEELEIMSVFESSEFFLGKQLAEVGTTKSD